MSHARRAFWARAASVIRWWANSLSALTISGFSSIAAEPVPLAWWDFETDATDRIGNFSSSTLFGGSSVSGGSLLIPDAPGDRLLASGYGGTSITEKTLVAWVYLNSLSERGGSVISLQSSSGVVFDGIVYAERQPLRWMAGSDNYNRTQDVGGPDETASPSTLVQMAIVYRPDNSITLYRDGNQYGVSYTAGSLQTYNTGGSSVSFGLRHTGGMNSDLAVRIEDARIYGQALSPAQISALQVNAIPEPTIISLALAVLAYSFFHWARQPRCHSRTLLKL